MSSPELLMKKTFGTSNSDFGVDLIQLDHEIYCLGSTTIDDESKIFMVKTDTNGIELKREIYDLSFDLEPVSIQPYQDQLIIFGNLIQNDSFQNTFYLEINKDLEQVSFHVFNDGFLHKCKDAIVDNDRALLVGSHNDTLSIVGIDLLSGDISQVNTVQSEFYTGSRTLLKNDDGYLVLGYSFKQNDYRLRDYYLVQFDHDLDTLWSKVYATDYYHEEHAINSSEDGFYYIAGHSTELDTEHNMSVLKIDENANVLNQLDFGGEVHDGAHDLVIHQDKVYVLGRTNSYGSGNQDIMILKTNQLEVGDSMLIGGVLNDYAYNMKLYDDKLWIL